MGLVLEVGRIMLHATASLKWTKWFCKACWHVWHSKKAFALNASGWYRHLSVRYCRLEIHSACRCLVTSYLAADMFFRRDDLVHVCSQSGVQWSFLSLTGFDQRLILSAGLSQNLPVHCIGDLEKRERTLLDSWTFVQRVCRAPYSVIQTHQHPVSLPLLNFPPESRTNYVFEIRVEGLHHKIS